MKQFSKWNGKRFSVFFVWVLLLPLVIGAIACGGESAPPCDDVVTFPDPNLEEAVREAIDKSKGDICQADIVELATLKATLRGINDLRGLEHCSTLQELNLERNEITDLSPLSNLSNLRRLYLGENQINDISPLANLEGLHSLLLNDNQISDISPLSNLLSLSDLSLENNRISDIFPLANLLELYDLGLDGNMIADISPLSNLTHLGWLYLNYNQISDLSPLVGTLKKVGPVGGLLQVYDNPLSDESIDVYIPQIQEKGFDVQW